MMMIIMLRLPLQRAAHLLDPLPHWPRMQPGPLPENQPAAVLSAPNSWASNLDGERAGTDIAGIASISIGQEHAIKAISICLIHIILPKLHPEKAQVLMQQACRSGKLISTADMAVH